MREFDIVFGSANLEHFPKRIAARVVEPDCISPGTGLLHCAHGWGRNRLQYLDLMRAFANQYNLVCVATEFRQSGYDFDPMTGVGADRPYDGSHYQVLDCLNAVREALAIYPGIDRRRLLLFGGSQGGHISMLMAVFAPETFACVFSGSGISRFDEERVEWSARHFSPDELAVRDAVRLADRVLCAVVLNHGTADSIVPDSHTRELEAALRAAEKVEVRCQYIEGGGHALEPVTDRQTLAIDMADDLLRNARRCSDDDFLAHRKVHVPGVGKTLALDWSRAASDHQLMRWI